MVLLVLFIFTLFLEVHPQRLSDQVWLTASPASVQKDTSTAQLRYDRPTDTHRADRSHDITVLLQKERPVITVTYDSQTGDFKVYCKIPGSGNASACFIYIGDENRLILKSQKPSGTTQCISSLHETYLFNKLKSVKSKVMSCRYSPESASSTLSPYSDKFNLTAFLSVQVQSPHSTKASILYSTPTFFTSETIQKSTTWHETPINSTAENTHPLNVTRNTTAAVKASTPGKTYGHRTPQTKTLLIMALGATSGGIFLTGLMGICLFCISKLPTHSFKTC
ncbi:uncharacterized protein [Pseudorasbora parva]|uniref:uncharacterized protein n=1 Tax=Pseudorasbora parva TaxID=51549 RepID=UPI00351E7C41